jgi:hypothetical protein
MLSGAAKHTTGEASGVRTLEVGKRVNRKFGRLVGGSGLIALHGLLSGRHESSSKSGDVIGVINRSGDRDGRNGNGGSKSSGRKVFELAEDRLGN